MTNSHTQQPAGAILTRSKCHQQQSRTSVQQAHDFHKRIEQTKAYLDYLESQRRQAVGEMERACIIAQIDAVQDVLCIWSDPEEWKDFMKIYGIND